MNREEAKELLPIIQAFADGKRVEKFDPFIQQWIEISDPVFIGDQLYRIAAPKPSIDWSHVAPEYRWLAVDEDGVPFLYQRKPYKGAKSWMIISGKLINALCFTSYHCPPDVDWRESLVKRPD